MQWYFVKIFLLRFHAIIQITANYQPCEKSNGQTLVVPT